MYKSALEVQSLDIHKAKPQKWLWKNRLLANSLNLLIGNEGVGKGTLIAWILARATTGKLDGHFWETPCNVAIIGDEDSFHHVWGPRLWSVGVAAERVKRIRRRDLDAVDIRREINELSDIVQANRIRVLYFDQLLDNLSLETDHYHAKQVRTAISPLQTIAEELKVSVIATLHPNKRAENFRQLIQGSSAFNAVSRSSLLLADHPDEEDKRVLVVGKSNYAGRGHAVEFQIMEDHIRPNGRLLSTTRVVSVKKSKVSIDELIENSAKGPKKAPLKEQIRGRLTQMMGDMQWHPAEEMIGELVHDGFAERTVQAAATQLKMQRKKAGMAEGWMWRLPRDDVDAASRM